MGKSQNSSIQVVCRFRPQNALEDEMHTENVVEVYDNNVASIQNPGQKAYRFDFDYVFDGNSRQEDVFEKTAAPMVEEIIQGYNSTIFAYGQTGSGKTFTMQGTPENQGLIPRTVQRLFQVIMASPDQIEFTIRVSYIEIYLEKIRDLLDCSRENLRIREGPTGMWVEGATETYVSTASELLNIMNLGIANRVFSSTRMNLESSRSHAVFMIAVQQSDRVTKSKKHAKLLLVDLAGSEKVEKTEAWGTALKEAQNINKSLSALGNVINALTTNSPHIPYRDSKLTKLLTDSLGGNSLCCLIICCSPSLYNVVETITTCRFGQRAKLIQNKAKINQEKSLAEYKALLEQAERKIAQQAEIIARLEAPLSDIQLLDNNELLDEQDEEEARDGFGEELPNTRRGSRTVNHRISVAAGSALNEMQEKILNLEKELHLAQDETEGLRDQLSEKQSEIEILHESLNTVEGQLQEYKTKADESEWQRKHSLDEVAILQAQTLKVNLELEQQRLRAEQAEVEAQRYYDENRTRLEGLGTWTKQFEPKPTVDETLSPAKQIHVITKQYVGLFHELVDKVEKILELQEANSDLQEEVKAYRKFLEKGSIDDETRRLFSKRAFAEKQAAKLSVENVQLRRIEEEQAKLLDSWKSRISDLETGVDTMITLGRRRQDQTELTILDLKQEIDAYRAELQRRRDTVSAVIPHIHKPIVGGMKTELVHSEDDKLSHEDQANLAEVKLSIHAEETKSSHEDVTDDPFLIEDLED